MIKQHLRAELHRSRCNRAALLPMLDKLDKHELEALWRLIQTIKEDAKMDGKRLGRIK